jgi:DNA-binding HxlR family transcriptional regulator
VPLRSDWSTASCPMARSLEVLGDPWVMLILREALTGSTRYEQFRSALRVADNVLSLRLRAMVEAGLLERSPYRAGQRTHDEYRLTPAGADLLPVVHALILWGEKHRPPPDESSRLTILHDGCGEATTSSESCSRCGLPLRPGNVHWHRPWLGPEPVGVIQPAPVSAR